MFDFFDEFIEFLSQISHIFNWAWDIVQIVINLLSNITFQFQPVLVNAPPKLSTLILFLLSSLLFDFIRGRSR